MSAARGLRSDSFVGAAGHERRRARTFEWGCRGQARVDSQSSHLQPHPGGRHRHHARRNRYALRPGSSGSRLLTWSSSTPTSSCTSWGRTIRTSSNPSAWSTTHQRTPAARDELRGLSGSPASLPRGPSACQDRAGVPHAQRHRGQRLPCVRRRPMKRFDSSTLPDEATPRLRRQARSGREEAQSAGSWLPGGYGSAERDKGIAGVDFHRRFCLRWLMSGARWWSPEVIGLVWGSPSGLGFSADEGCIGEGLDRLGKR